MDLAWSPDGTIIAFSSPKAGSYDIYVVNCDGSGEQKFTNDGSNIGPNWSFDSKAVSFILQRKTTRRP